MFIKNQLITQIYIFSTAIPKQRPSHLPKARNLQIIDDLLILHRDKIIPKYCGGLYGGCPSCRRDDGLSRSIVKEKEERKGEGDRRTGETEACSETRGRTGIHRGGQRHDLHRPDQGFQGILEVAEDERKGMETILSPCT